MADQPSSQNILWARQQQEFVGRKAELTFFREFLTSTPREARFRRIISLFGDGGVGKTWLMRQMQQAADNTNALTAYSDETQKDVLAVMDNIASQMERSGGEMKNFRPRYKTYLQNINRIEADPQAPQGLTDLLGRLAVRATFVAGDLVPGLRKGLEFLPQDQLEIQGGEWLSFLVKKLSNKDEISLVLEPVQILSPLFLQDIQKIAADHPQLILFLDTYEKTDEYLDSWLRNLLAGRYGDWPLNVRLVIAGQELLRRGQWANFLEQIDYRNLSPFSEEEARAYLSKKRVTDERVVAVILHLSQRLPLLVATLAAQSPEDPDQVGESSGDAIERFLEWVEDPQRREVALSAAFLRRINKDLLAVLVGAEKSGSMFEWLSHMPFVEMGREGWVYHDVVRTLMLRYKLRESPQGWSELHRQLAEYFEGTLTNLGLEPGREFESSSSQNSALEASYHRLCQAYSGFKGRLLNDFVRAIQTQPTFARSWADMIAQAERDLEIDPKESWGAHLAQGLQAFDEKRYQEAAQMFTRLLNRAALQTPYRPVVLARRGLTNRLAGYYNAAISDLNEAVRLNPADVWALIQRGETYRQQGDFEKALSDYDQAIQQESENTWAIVLKAETYRQSRRFEEALTEFQKATEKDPENAWAVVLQSEAYLQMGQYEKALTGFDRAVELVPDYAFAITHRGEAYRQVGQVERALADFNRALELDPNFTWAWVLRGETRRQMGKAEASIEDFNRAIELASNDPWPITLRGEAYRQTGQVQLALADYDRAIALKPDYTWPITLRGETRRQRGDFEEALTDFNRALQIEPENVWTRALRGETHRQMGNGEAALADMNQALEREPNNSWLLSLRSHVYRDMGQYERALADCNRALEIQPDYALPMAQRGETYRQMGQFEQALADLSQALERVPKDGWALARRGKLYHQMKRYKESLHDFTRADLKPDDTWASEQRQELYDLLEFREGAWRAAYKDRLLEVYYEEGEHRSQYAALHLNDSYFRMVYGPDSGWGTSVILLPVYWSRGTQHQGGQVDAQPHVEGNDLVLDMEGIVGDLHVTCQLCIQPPGEASILAHIMVQVSGQIELDDRPIEAFKPVMLSSMHISSKDWDARVAYVGHRPHEIPESRWIIQPPETKKCFGLRGGTSEWKKNAPTIFIEIDRPLQITGWVTPSKNPNDDNVALWVASKELLTSWEYTIQAQRA